MNAHVPMMKTERAKDTGKLHNWKVGIFVGFFFYIFESSVSKLNIIHSVFLLEIHHYLK